jgi:hypothetical protein
MKFYITKDITSLLRNSFVPMLFEQLLNSAITFVFTLLIIRGRNLVDIAAIGVSLTGLYLLLTVSRYVANSRSLISIGDFQSGETFLLKHSLVKLLQLSPILFLGMFSISTLSGLDANTSLHFATLLIVAAVWDSIRTVSIRTRGPQLLILGNMMSLIVLLITVSLLTIHLNFLNLWSLTLSASSVCYILLRRHLRDRTEYFKKYIEEPSYVLTSSVTVEILIAQLIILIWSYFLLQFKPYFSGELRLTQIWVINIASTFYVTLSTLKHKEFLSGKFSINSLTRVNYFAALCLFVAGAHFIIISHFKYFDLPRIDFKTILGTSCLFYTFFVYSRNALLYPYLYKPSQFVLRRAGALVLLFSIVTSSLFFVGNLGFLLTNLFFALLSTFLYKNLLLNLNFSKINKSFVK